MALNRIRLKYQADAGDPRAETIKRILSNPDRLLGIILLGNTLANISAASLVTYLIAVYVPRDHVDAISLVGSVSLAALVLIFCELTPKIIAANNPERVSRSLLGTVLFALRILAPFANLASWIANRIVRLSGLSPNASPFVHALSED